MTDETGDTGENRVNARRSQSLPSRDDRCAADDRLDSPVRKLPRRQSVPARLSSHKDYSGNGGGVGDSSTRIPVEGHQLVVKGVTGRSERLKKVRPSRRKQGMHRRSTPSRLAPQIREDESCSGNSAEELIPLPPPRKHSARVTAAERPWKGAPWAPPDYLSGGQKKIYFHVSKVPVSLCILFRATALYPCEKIFCCTRTGILRWEMVFDSLRCLTRSTPLLSAVVEEQRKCAEIPYQTQH